MIRARLLLAAAVLGVGGCSTAAREAPAGRWALHDGGRTVMIVRLKRDRHALGGWSGRLSRPEEAQMEGSRFTAIEGPVVHRRLRSTEATGEGIELVARGDKRGDTDVYLVRSGRAGGTIDLRFKGVEMAPLILVPARSGERVETKKARASRSAPGRS